MQKLSKPTNFGVLWAQSGSKADITNKSPTGWQVEIPEREVMNGLQYRQDYGIAYLLQNGVADYDISSIYYSGQITNVDGQLYRAKSQSQGIHPATGTSRDTYWEKVAPNWGEYLVIKNRIDSPDPFNQYILKSRPEVSVDYIGTGLVSFANNNLRLKFISDKLTYVNGTTTIATFPKEVLQPDNDSTDIATTAWVKSLLRDAIAKLEVAVGESIISQNPENPAITKGYGTWVLDCQGRAIVGVSSLTSDPSWTRSVNSVAGAYTVALSVAEMPRHNHFTDSRFNKLTAIASDVYADASVRQTTCVTYDYGSMEVELGIGSITEKAKGLMAIQDAGGNQAHNNVQPSQTKYIWTRTK